GEAVSAWREPWSVRAGRWLARHRPLVYSSAAATVVAVVLLTGATFLLSAANKVAVANARWAKEQAEVARVQAERADEEATRAATQAERATEAKERATEAKERARQYLYISNMSLAQTAWHDAQIDRVLDLLDRQRPREGEEDLRGFDWHYL